MDLIYALLLGALAGWIAGKLTKGSGFGALGNIVVGILGGVLGSWVFTLLGFGAENLIGQLITAVVGAVLLLFLLGKVKK
ncbi:MAG: GlsB/YeaQ/YmgE family stress response membrane protein [Planctomycetota bacterium]